MLGCWCFNSSYACPLFCAFVSRSPARGGSLQVRSNYCVGTLVMDEGGNGLQIAPIMPLYVTPMRSSEIPVSYYE
jgi:hypothetical protein